MILSKNKGKIKINWDEKLTITNSLTDLHLDPKNYVLCKVSNVAMAVAESVKIKTKLAWNVQTEEKFALQHFYIITIVSRRSYFCYTCCWSLTVIIIGFLSTVPLSKIISCYNCGFWGGHKTLKFHC